MPDGPGHRDELYVFDGALDLDGGRGLDGALDLDGVVDFDGSLEEPGVSETLGETLRRLFARLRPERPRLQGPPPRVLGPRQRPAGTPRPARLDAVPTESDLVVRTAPESFQAEQYRAFRTNLRALGPTVARTMLFVSAHPDDGKSTTVGNVALAMAEWDQARTCLIDGDLRMPSLHKMFDIPCEPGLTDMLTDRLPPRDVISTVDSGLSLIPAGRGVDDIPEVIASEYLGNLLGHLKQNYDEILIDSPPALLYADAANLARLVDGVVLVVAVKKTPRREVEELLWHMRSAGASVLGCFVTGGKTMQPDIVYAPY